MQNFVKKPIVIQAIQVPMPNGDPSDAIVELVQEQNWEGDSEGIQISTLEGNMLASPGDWIIKGIQGEYYPCKPDIFEATYNVVVPIIDSGDDMVVSVVADILEITDKHDKLVAFTKSPVFGDLDPSDQMMLQVQLASMDVYGGILAMRLDMMAALDA